MPEYIVSCDLGSYSDQRTRQYIPPTATEKARELVGLVEMLESERDKSLDRERVGIAQHATLLCKWDAHVTRILGERDVARAQREACEQNARELVAAAEAKVADLGWRKNRLLEAVEAKGFTVRWAQDGTPRVLTAEEVKAEDAPKPAPGPKMTNVAEFMRAMGFEDPRSPLTDFTRTFSAFEPLSYFPSLPKPPAPPPPPGQEYYDRALRRCGLTMPPPQFRVDWSPWRERLDAALRAELGERFGYVDMCDVDCCPFDACAIWRGRPWKA